MAYRYQGPAKVLYLAEGGKAYGVGDAVPISKEMALRLGAVRNGAHRFEGLDVPEREAAPAEVAKDK